jgi:membrane protein
MPKPRRRSLAALVLDLSPWAALGLAAVWMARPVRRKPGLSVQADASPAQLDSVEPGHGRLARGPRHIPAKGWRDVLWRTFREVSQDRLGLVAAGVTFYSLLAVVPALGVFVSLYGLFADVGEVNRQLAQIAAFLPRDVLSIVGDQMMRLALRDKPSLSLAFLISLLISVWSANAAMKALFDGLNVAYDETEKRNFLKVTVLTYLFTLGLLVFLTVMAGVLVGVPLLMGELGFRAFEAVWAPLRWLLLLGVTTAAFSIVYRYGPSRERARWRWVSWGAGLAAVLWIGGSMAFSWYVNNVAQFDATYGSLGAVIGFMTWIWVSTMVVLIGAELNAEIEHQTALDSTTGTPMPMGARGAAMADTVGLPANLNLRAQWARIRGRRAPVAPAKDGAEKLLKPAG